MIFHVGFTISYWERTMRILLTVLVALALEVAAMGEQYQATPDNLRDIVAKLQAGDTVLLADGDYAGGVEIRVSGTKESPIRIKAAGEKAVFTGGRNSVMLAGSYIEVEGLRCTGAERAGVSVGRSEGCAVRKCVCYDNGTWGIFSGFAEALTVEDNVCRGSKREHGIYLSNSTDHAIVRRNHCHNNARCGIQFNGDPFIPGGDGVMSYNLIEGNILHDNMTNFNVTCVADSVIRNNLFYHCKTKAMALWDTLAGYQYSSKNNVIVNNTFIMDNATRECIQLRNGATGNTIRNNIFVCPYYSIVADPSSVEGTVIDHNLYFASIEPERFIWGGFFRSLGDMRKEGFCEGDFQANPKFVDAARFDFRLAADSPAVDAGKDDKNAGEVELDGKPRVAGKGIDIGAYELQR